MAEQACWVILLLAVRFVAISWLDKYRLELGDKGQVNDMLHVTTCLSYLLAISCKTCTCCIRDL